MRPHGGQPDRLGHRHGDSDRLRLVGDLEHHRGADGTYTLQSVASYAGGVSGPSPGITITVANTPPTSAVVVPSVGSSVSGTQVLDASASSGVTQVQYELTGGSLTDSVIATATATVYGWLATWNTTAVPNGTYTLQSVASYAGGVSGPSPGITITVAN